jgi:sugar O-acyltransferase (sialic acid O-acetyltransferase NeuD family)
MNRPAPYRAAIDRPVIVIGAGGHAAVVADALLAAGAAVIGFTETDPAQKGRHVCGLPVLGDDTVLAGYAPDEIFLANGIGGVRTEMVRRDVQQRLAGRGWRFVTVCHPTAVISPYSIIAESAQMLAQCVVQVGAEIGEGCIVNTAAVVEHHARIGAWVHVAPRALICGEVMIGGGSHVGAGATVRQGIRIGASTLIGAGAVVVSDFAGCGVLAGVPARRVELKS